MKRILKYEVGRDGQAATLSGQFVRLLDVQSQGPSICVWIECDESAPEVSIDVVAIGTGWDLPDELMVGLNYVGTVLDGPYVWHYYWRMTPAEVEDEGEENKEEVVE